MFTNLRTALYLRGISINQYAEFLGVDERTAEEKMIGTMDFTYPEFKRTCTLLLPEFKADYLFYESSPETRSA